jgi:hypothetical protein
MRLIVALTSFLVCCSSFTSAVPKKEIYEEMTTKVYEASAKLLTALFQTGGGVIEQHHLRTVESNNLFTETVHVSYFKDAACTQLAYAIDDKINRCSPLLGGAKATIIGEDKNSWRVKLQSYDSSCENALPIPPMIRDFKKNTCMAFNGAYITVDMVVLPDKIIPGSGGGAFVFYDSFSDCTISKQRGDLARATTMLSLPPRTCNDFLGLDLKVEVCDANSVGFSFWESVQNECDSSTFGTVMPIEDFACSSIGPVPPVRLLCLG